jgi:hypothetical protein
MRPDPPLNLASTTLAGSAAAELTPQAIADILEQVRVGAPRWFARTGLLERKDVRQMRPARSRPGPPAAFRSTRRCALPPGIVQAWSDCCAVVPAQGASAARFSR